MKNELPATSLGSSIDGESDPLACARALLPHIERLDLLLQRAVHKIDADPDDRLALHTLVLSPKEVEARMSAPAGLPQWVRESGIPVPPAPPVTGRLAELTRRFALSDVERDVLLLSLMPRLDLRYAALFSYLQRHKPNQDWPTLDVALGLLGFNGAERLAQRALLGQHAAIFYYGLVDDPARKSADEPLRELRGDSGVHAFLTGATPSLNLAGAAWLASTTQKVKGATNAVYCVNANMGYAAIAPDLTASLTQSWSVRDALIPVTMLRGDDASVQALAVQAASRSGRAVLRVNFDEFPDDETEARRALLKVLREARLWDACLLLLQVDDFATKRGALFTVLEQRVNARAPSLMASAAADMHRSLAESSTGGDDTHAAPIVVSLPPHAPLRWLGRRPHVLHELPLRQIADDMALLRVALARRFEKTSIDDEAMLTVVQRFRPSPTMLDDVLDEADLYRQREGQNTALRKEHLTCALGLRAQRNFGKLAQRVTPTRGLKDLVLPDGVMQQVREVMAAVKQRDKVLAQGFSRKLGTATGISALFYGSSGTGKTLAAEVLAAELGVDLIKIDLSTVVNKYIGETEKNLSKIFDLASMDAGVLFFDEADALFGKRSESKDAHDRHANIEVSYLLQRLESYQGLIVLSTNHREHLDEAFTRRITFMVEFEFPDEAVRERVWRSIWPEGVTLAPDVNLARLAKTADVAGGNIRNVALLASCFAAEEGLASVGLKHIERAMGLEFSKMGRLWWAQ